MTAIKGTNLAAPIVPFDDADTYPTHDSFYGIGGWREVADTTARDAIPVDRRRQGMVVFCQDTSSTFSLGADLTTWSVYGAGNIAFGVYFPGKPSGSQFILDLPMVAACTFPISLTGSKFNTRVVPTADTTFTLLKNGTGIGTVKFAAITGTATVTFASAESFTAGDTLGIQAPSSADSTAADFGFNLLATL